MSADSEERTLDARRSDYQTMLSVLAHNTGDPQPPLADARTLYTATVCHGSLPDDVARSTLQAARENDHVIRWTDGDGRVRYGLTADGVSALERGSDPLGPDDADAIRAYLSVEVSRETVDKDFVGWCNRRLAAIEP